MKTTEYSIILRCRSALTLIVALAAAAVTVRGATQISASYTPLHPGNNEAVRVTINAKNPQGLSKIKLYAYEYEWQTPVSVLKRPGGLWQKVGDWNTPGAPSSTTRTYSKTTGFPASTFVCLLIEVTPAVGLKTTEIWGFTAGDWPYGNLPIPLWIVPPEGEQGGFTVPTTEPAKAERINVVFIAQNGDYATPRAMLPDLHSMIFDGFMQNSAVLKGKPFWAFHYSPEHGFIEPYSDTADMTLTGMQIQTTNMVATTGLIVHHTDFRDWRGGHFAGTKAGVNNFPVTLHEIGHSVFDLADEYDNAPNHSLSDKRFHNIHETHQKCFLYLLNEGVSTSWATDCNQIPGTGRWRAEPVSANCLMRTVDHGATFGKSCLHRVQWFYEGLQ